MAKVRVVLNSAGVRGLLQSPDVSSHLQGKMRAAAGGDADVTAVTGRTRANIRAEIRGGDYEKKRDRLMGILGMLR